ncbi:hypothetical protein GCM10023169_08270 [Georgenia halophila]|uniref:DUF4349 domain-containing protein n=1 Tax=Georgenia halophila TaxID=620889 RepID=A0ABP8KY82_9MICO
MGARFARLLVGLFAVALLLVGCTGGGAGDDGAGGGGNVEDPGAGGFAAEEAAAQQEEQGDRQVITTANATLVVGQPTAAADEIVGLAEAAGGHVEHRTEHRGDEERSTSASVSVRVPAAELTGLLEDLEDIGEVTDLSQDVQDVTRAVRDLDARIVALETSVERLLEIMAEAENASALIEAETPLSERQAELESLRSERDYLADQVAMSTLRVELRADDAPTVEADGFLGGLSSGWNALVAAFSGLLVLVGVLLPWLLVLGVPLVAVVWFVRRRRRSRAAGPTAAPTAPDAEVSAT